LVINWHWTLCEYPTDGGHQGQNIFEEIDWQSVLLVSVSALQKQVAVFCKLTGNAQIKVLQYPKSLDFALSMSGCTRGRVLFPHNREPFSENPWLLSWRS
jgi:hypothetical protein